MGSSRFSKLSFLVSGFCSPGSRPAKFCCRVSHWLDPECGRLRPAFQRQFPVEPWPLLPWLEGEKPGWCGQAFAPLRRRVGCRRQFPAVLCPAPLTSAVWRPGSLPSVFHLARPAKLRCAPVEIFSTKLPQLFGRKISSSRKKITSVLDCPTTDRPDSEAHRPSHRLRPRRQLPSGQQPKGLETTGLTQVRAAPHRPAVLEQKKLRLQCRGRFEHGFSAKACRQA